MIDHKEEGNKMKESIRLWLCEVFHGKHHRAVSNEMVMLCVRCNKFTRINKITGEVR